MSDSDDRSNNIRTALEKARLCIVAGPNRNTDGFTARVFKGQRDTVPECRYEVGGKQIETKGATLKEAITLCEDAVMAHLGVLVSEPSEMQAMEAKLAEMAAEIANLKGASAPAPAAPTKPPKPSKPESASV
jgi:hypothetical protein